MVASRIECYIPMHYIDIDQATNLTKKQMVGEPQHLPTVW
jgi:hypothetical protein